MAQKPGLGTERGVSPAIAVLLMAAVAIILAASIGAFVLGFGEETREPAPVVSTEFDRTIEELSTVTDDVKIDIVHEGGENIPVSDLEVITTAQCFNTDTLNSETKTGSLVNLPVSGGISPSNIEGDDIFEQSPNSVDGPIQTPGGTATAGTGLQFEIDGAECELPPGSNVETKVRHKPSNTLIITHESGVGFTPEPLRNEFNPATANKSSTHKFVLSGISFGQSGNNGDEVDTITLDYPSGASMDGLDESDITVTMTRTLASGVDRSTISVNDDSYSGSTATFDLSGPSQTDVAGPVEVEIDGIENPPAGDYTVDITLKGDAHKTVSQDLNITSP
jgi:FlaG/FlaF family flagellin (archaellin)